MDVKTHLKEHKEAYITGGICLGVGVLAGITGAIVRSNIARGAMGTDGVQGAPISTTSLGDIVRQPISRGISATADYGISVAGKKVSLNNVSYIFSHRQGSPSWVVRCLETGAIFTSQRSAATELDLPESELSKHLNGVMDHVRGYHFERICMAA